MPQEHPHDPDEWAHRAPLDYEVLERLEAQLRHEDPHLLAALQHVPPPLDGRRLRAQRTNLLAFALLMGVCTWLTGWAPFFILTWMSVCAVILLTTADQDQLVRIERRLARLRLMHGQL